MKREDGFYWVLQDVRWFIAEWDNHVGGWLMTGIEVCYIGDDNFDEIDEQKIERFVSPNANTVLDVVADPEDLKCCGNCAHQLNDFLLRISCELNENNIIPCCYCSDWKYDEHSKKQRIKLLHKQ